MNQSQSPQADGITQLPENAIHGTSEMAHLIRSYNWRSTALGPIENWSPTLIARVNRLLESSYLGTLIWGEDNILFYNDASIQTIKDQHPWVLGKPISTVFLDAWPIIRPDIEACFLHGETVIRENILIPLRANGVLEDFYFTYFLAPVFDAGKIAGQLGVHLNTTEHVLAIRERDATAAQLTQVLDATSDGVVSINREWNITYLNHSAIKMLGPAPLMIGANIWDICPHRRDPASPFTQVYERAMFEGIPQYFEGFYPHPVNLWVNLQARPSPDGIIVFIRDISEQRRSEKALREVEDRERKNLEELFEQAPVFIAVLGGPEHVFEMVNQSYKLLTGDRDMIGRRVVDCIPEVAGTGWIDLLDKVYRTGESISEQGARLSLATVQGQPLEDKFIDYIYQPRRGPDGSITGIIALGVDTSLSGEILQSTSDGVFMLDRNWRFIYLNPQAITLLTEKHNLVGCNMWEEFPAAINLEFWTNYHITMEQRTPTHFVAYYPAPLDRWFELHSYPAHQGISVFFRDVTTKRMEDERLRLLEQTVASAPIGITLARYDDPHTCPLIYVNPAFERMTGYSSEEVVGRDCRFLQGSDIQQEGRTDLRHAIDEGLPNKALLRNYTKAGHRFINEVHVSHVYDEHGKITHVIGIQNDVTEQYEIKEQLARQARYDALTGLPNRYLLIDQIRQALQSARDTGGHVAVVLFDLDNFKHMNDRFGHIEADRILTQIGRRLSAIAENPERVARLGGDEFALIFSDWKDQGLLEKQMERLLKEVRKPLQLSSGDVMITGSAGVAIFPQDAVEPEELLQLADLSMYWIKRAGKNSFRFYSPDLRLNSNEPLDVALGFRRALANSEFELLYQPRISVEANQMNGFEALIRWNHPERGVLLPAQFVQIAEDTGFINEIGQWVLEEALRQNALWRNEGLEAIRMSVNVSASQILDPSFPTIVANALANTGMPAASLELELTESLLIDNGSLAEISLSALKELGVRIAIDDFGSGYSGLHYLSRYPVDTIKIDQYFTRHIATDKTAATICQSVLRLGHDLGLTTVAEGVEHHEQASLLKSWNCSELQGYLFATPLSSHDAKELFLEARLQLPYFN